MALAALMRFTVAPALIPCGSSRTAPGSSGPGGSFSDELGRLQSAYRAAWMESAD